jgi:Sulfotransferase domain
VLSDSMRSLVRPVVRRVMPWRRTIRELQAALADASARNRDREAELAVVRNYIADLEARIGAGLVREEELRTQLTVALDQLARFVRPPIATNVYIFTLPKSGSVYLVNLLHKGLGCAIRSASLGYFPRDLLDWNKMEELRPGNNVVQAHLDASPANLQILRAFRPRFQVHLRDPRQAMLSMTHHLVRHWRETPGKNILLQVEPTPPPAFYDCPLTAQIDWMIENYLPGCFRWMREWLDVIESGEFGPDLLLTTYEEFVRDEAGFVRQVLRFFGIPEERYEAPAMERTMAVHFRQGTPDEWKSAFTLAQQTRATAMIPPEWIERFGWV